MIEVNGRVSTNVGPWVSGLPGFSRRASQAGCQYVARSLGSSK
jgi:hypothetical protein